MVERNLAKVDVVGSNPIIRSQQKGLLMQAFFVSNFQEFVYDPRYRAPAVTLSLLPSSPFSGGAYRDGGRNCGGDGACG